jgi:hypothetical protein
VTLSVSPRACVPAGQAVTVRVRGRAGRVRFRLDVTGPVRVVRHRPFVARFRLAFPSGTRHVVQARVVLARRVRVLGTSFVVY